MAAAHRLIRLGYRPKAIGDEEVRKYLEIKEGPCADLVFETGPNSCIVAESKGETIRNGIRQLENTIPKAANIFRSVEARLLIHLGGNSKLGVAGIPDRTMQAVGDGYTAVRQRDSGQYILHDPIGDPKKLPSGQYIVVEFW
jgi:hypothetical protein